MSLLAAALALLLASPATAQAPGGCQYQGARVNGPGMQYLSTRLTVPRDGRCSHSLNDTAGSAEVVAQPRNGRLEVSPGSLTYTPNPGFIGTDQYVFSGRHTGGRAQVTVDVEVR